MSLLRIALPVLAVAGSVYAECSNSATATIQNGGDASAIATCTTYSGSIAIATGVADDISFDGNLENLTGDLIVESNSNIRRVGSSKLKTIGGKLTLNDVSQLAALTFSALTEVDSLTLNGLPNLRSLGFDAKINKCSNINIQNTQLQDIAGIDTETAETVIISNNNAVANISMQTVNITSKLELSFNNADVDVNFPLLESANNMSLRAIGSISIPALSQLNKGSLGIYDSNLESFAAPNLTKIDGGLTFDNDDNLKNISLPKLEKVGANLQISNNSNLHELKSFGSLTDVGAALDMSGNLTDVEIPKLNYVKGVFNLQSTGDIGDSCTNFDGLRDKGKIPKGQYQCKGQLQQAGTAGTTPQGGSNNGNKPSSASPLNVQSIYLGLAGVAALLLL